MPDQTHPRCGCGGEKGTPWVLFCAERQPDSILPAMRPGTVMSVRGMSMHEAKSLVLLANHRPEVAEAILLLTQRHEAALADLRERAAVLVETAKRGGMPPKVHAARVAAEIRALPLAPGGE